MNNFIRSAEITFEVIDGDLLLLNPKEAKAFECNEIITDLWKILENEHSFSQIVDKLLSIYDVGRPELEEDISSSLNDMLLKGLVLKK